MRRLTGLTIIALSLAASPAFAQNFSCRNASAQIECADGRCTVETSSFTPMSLSRSGSRLSICAYSGCWSGPIVTRRTRGSIDFLYATPLRGESPTRGRSDDLAVLYNRASRTAQISWGGFANVMDCGAED